MDAAPLEGQALRRKRGVDGAAGLCAGGLLAALVAAAVWMSLTRGPWIDEFSTLWMSEPGVPLGRLLTDRLAFDVHPPFYVLATRALREGWRGADLTTLRLMNLVPLAIWTAYAAGAWVRRPASRAFIAAVFVFALAATALEGSMATLRPYFALDCAAGVFALAAALLYRDARAARRLPRSDLAAALLSLAVLMSGHYLAAYETGLLAAAFSTGLFVTGRRREAITVLIAAAVAALPAAVFLAWRSRYMAGWTGGGFWIRTDTREALAVISLFLLRSTGFNLLAYAAAAIALAQGLRRGRVDPARELVLISLAAVAAALGGLLLVNLQTNIVVDRYLVFLNGALAVGLGAAVVGWSERRPWLYAGTLALSLAAGSWGAWSHARMVSQGWASTARLVAADVKACPGARVDTFHWSDRYFKPLPTDPPVRDYAYARLARQFGFAEALNRPLAQTDPRCPRILWGEHLGPALGLPTEMEIMLKLMSGRNPIPQAFIRPDLDVQRGESGYVLVAPARPHP